MTTTPAPPAEPHRRTSARSRAVVDALVAAGLLDPVRRGQAADVVSDALDGATQAGASSRRWLPEVAGYLGGALVIAAALIFFFTAWGDLSVAGQLTILGIATVVLATAGLIVRAGGPRSGPEVDIRRRLAATLLAGAAGTVAGFAGLVTDELDGVEWGSAPGTVAATVLLLAGVAGYLRAPSVLGQLVAVWGAASLVVQVIADVLDLSGTAVAVAMAAALGALGLVWLVLAERRVWHERLAARIIGCLVVAFAVQWPIFEGESWLGYGLTALAAALAFGVYVERRAWPYLALGVGLVSVVVPQALLEVTDGALGTAGVLLAGGLVLLTGSVLGLRVHREPTRSDA